MTFALHLRVRDHTTWFWRCVGMAFGHFLFGLSQFHGHGSWIVCEVALIYGTLFLFVSNGMFMRWLWVHGPHGPHEDAHIVHNQERVGYSKVHPKLRNINFHNVTHSLISWHPRERMFVVQISLLIVTFLSLISRNLSLMQTAKEVNPHPRIAPFVKTFFFLFFFLCHLLNVGACVHHIAREGQVEWTTLT